MATHSRNYPASTKITLETGSNLSVDTINLSKDVPKDIFAKYMPQRFSIFYDAIDQDSLTYPLPFPIDLAFLNNVNLLVDSNYLNRLPYNLISDQEDSYSVSSDGKEILFSSAVYGLLDETSDITIFYTPV